VKYPVLGLVLFAFSCATHAASFDCKKAQSKMEKAICENPKISKLDEELAENYQAAKGKLSADAQKVFVNGQRSWVKFLSASCFTDFQAKPASKEDAAKCLETEYKARVAGLKSTGSVVGGFKTYAYFEGDFKAYPKDEEVAFNRVSLVLIDENSDNANTINSAIKTAAGKTGIDKESTGAFTSDVSNSLTNLSADLILLTQSESVTGGAHPSEYTGYKYFSKELKRFIKVSDVFSNPKWKAVAQQMAKKHFEKEKTMDDVISLEITAEENDAFSFMLTEKSFFVDGFTSYAARANDGVTMKWDAFSKFLTPKGKELSLVGAPK
jgi:uncharacterized protein